LIRISPKKPKEKDIVQTITSGKRSQNTNVNAGDSSSIIVGGDQSEITSNTGPSITIESGHGQVSSIIVGDHSPVTINYIGTDISDTLLGDVPKRKFEASTLGGDHAEIEVHVLYDRASWSISSSDSFSNKNGIIDFNKFLDSKKFSSDVASYDAIVCLGLESSYWNQKEKAPRTVDLSDSRAVSLCGMISRKDYYNKDKTRIFGLPLGYNLNSNVTFKSDEELRQRSIIIIGIRSGTGDLKSQGGEQRIICEMFKKNKIENFQAELYSEIKLKNPLRYIKIERDTFTIYSSEC
jgi:hypothetical protein